jgi:glycosyltransferase involved in cell wall biosynthesis
VRELYGLIRESLLVWKEKGFVFLLKKAINVFRRLKAKKNIIQEHYKIPIIRNESREPIQAKVSVIIPTKNAGMDLQCLLEKIRNQKGLQEIEMIIIDSGSDDDTVQIAKKYTSKIYAIAPSDFNHGATRNLGAEKASGDFLIFMSQDAIPISDSCIFDVVSRMQHDERIAAASVKQVPRSDADLFACWQLWFYNNKLLNYTQDSIVFLKQKQLKSLSPFLQRRYMQIDNVFSCFRKAIFDGFKFRTLQYAEDLDLGMRLIEEGYKILFLTSVGVIHSHNRAPAYFLKRGYIDTRTLLKLLQYDPINWENIGIFSIDQLLSYMHVFYKNVNYAIKKLSALDSSDYSLDSFLLKIKTDIQNRHNGDISPGDAGFDELFNKIVMTRNDRDFDISQIKHDVLMNQYFTFLDNFFEYLNTGNIGITSENIREFISALYKLLAWTCGSHIGNYMIFSENMKRDDKSLYLESILGQE